MLAPSVTRRHLLAAGLAACAASRPALAAFPERRPVRWIVGFPAGGATDLLARLLGQAITPRLGQPVVVENRPGAASGLAAEMLGQAPPDGHTVMSADNSTLIINPVAYRRLPYDPDRDFRPVGLYAGFHFVLAVRADSPLRSLPEYLDRARASGAPVDYASPGIGTPTHLAMERLAREMRLRLNHIPYRGSAPVVNDLLAGAVSSAALDYSSAAEMVRAGRFRALVVFSAAPVPFLPDVPAMAEFLPGFVATARQGMIVPRATPDAVVERLSALLTEALAVPSVQARYAEMGLETPPSDPASFARWWQAEKAIWQPLIRNLGIALDG